MNIVTTLFLLFYFRLLETLCLHPESVEKSRYWMDYCTLLLLYFFFIGAKMARMYNKVRYCMMFFFITIAA